MLRFSLIIIGFWPSLFLASANGWQRERWEGWLWDVSEKERMYDKCMTLLTTIWVHKLYKQNQSHTKYEST